MKKLKFVSKKAKEKVNFFKIKDEFSAVKSVGGAHTELISNKYATVEGCIGVVDYKNDYVKIKLKKGYMIFCGKNFDITYYENEIITVCGAIQSVEFCV